METLEQLEKFFDERGIEGTGYFTDPDFVTAIIGMTLDERLVYDYRKMVEFLTECDGMEESEAMEFIDYNTIRSIPYMGDKAPVIVNTDIVNES